MTLSCRCSLLTAYDLPLERSSPWLEADFREEGIVTSDKRDNFLLFISLNNFRKGISRAHTYIRVYIEKPVTLSQLSQKACDGEQV